MLRYDADALHLGWLLWCIKSSTTWSWEEQLIYCQSRKKEEEEEEEEEEAEGTGSYLIIDQSFQPFFKQES